LLAALGLLDLAIHLALLGAIELPPWLGVGATGDAVVRRRSAQAFRKECRDSAATRRSG
jgi:hypothetical protein